MARITKMWQRQEVSKCCWKNGADRLAWHRVATNLPFVKKCGICDAQWSKARLFLVPSRVGETMWLFTQAGPLPTTSQYPSGPSFCQRCPAPGPSGHQCSGRAGKTSPPSVTLRQRCPWQSWLGSKGLGYLSSPTRPFPPMAPTRHLGAACHVEIITRPRRTGVAWSCCFCLSLSVWWIVSGGTQIVPPALWPL